MASLVALLLRHPLQTLQFSYNFTVLLLLALLRRLLLPHFPSYQSVRIQTHRAFLSATSTAFPDLARRLPVGDLGPARARKIQNTCATYLIPGNRDLSQFAAAQPQHQKKRCVALYAHGGGYARGEAKMYVDYMERWVVIAGEVGLDLVFLSVEYPLSTESSHPAQLNAFISTYQNLLSDGIPPDSIVFMGDSAGGGLSVLSAIELRRLGVPQPAAAVLISPWIDIALSAFEGGNAAVESDYFVMANEAVPRLARLFAGSYELDSPEVSPLLRKPEELRGLCPQLILAGAAEFALSDSKAWARMCADAGVPHKLHVEWAQLHIYAMGSRFIDPHVRRRTDLQILHWIHSHVR